MLVLVGPSATGKSAIVRTLEKKYNMEKFITCTTREMRIGEIEGYDYYFLTFNEFQKKMEEDLFIETVFYNNNFYGTLKSEAKDNKVVILEPVGLKTFYSKLDNLFSVYLEASEDLRLSRMVQRGDRKVDIEKRILADRIAFNKDDLQMIDCVINTENLTLDEIAEEIYTKYQAKTYNNSLK